MPAKSEAQFRAMQAAAHGNSTLGIPAKVGREFVEATPKGKKLPKRAAKKKPRHGGDVAELAAEMHRRGASMMPDTD